MIRLMSFFIFLTLAIYESGSVAVLSEKNTLEPIKPSPVDETSNDESPEKFVLPLAEGSSDSKVNKRDKASKDDKFIDDDRKDKRNHGRFSEREKSPL